MSDDQRRSRVTVLGSFTLSADGSGVPLGVDARRVVAYLAVHPRPQERAALAADLWPGVDPAAARTILAEAVAAVDVPGLIEGAEDPQAALSLAPGVAVDLAEAMTLIRALPTVPGEVDVDTTGLDKDILPGWTATWIAVERERFRQLRLHALEERTQRLAAAGRFDDAVAMARAGVRTAPSRESARRALIEAYLAQGDVAAAVNEYDEYQELLRSSVGPAATGLESLLPLGPAWPVLRARRVMPRSAVQLPGGIRAPRTGRRLVSGGSAPGNRR
jgi:tetratricopeptide (TPR) repeat protein